MLAAENSNRTARRIIVFLVVWLLTIVALCLANVYVLLAGTIGALVGLISYFVLFMIRRRPGAERLSDSTSTRAGETKPLACASDSGYIRRHSLRLAVRIVALAGILVTSYLLVRTYYWANWDPIGNPNDEGWGVVPSPVSDIVDNFTPVVGRSGNMAMIRRVRAGFVSLAAPVPYFVFVQTSGESPTKADLVFRYFATERGWVNPPKVAWTGDKRLLISTGPGDVLQITKQAPKIGNIIVEYSIASTTLQPALQFWQRPFF